MLLGKNRQHKLLANNIKDNYLPTKTNTVSISRLRIGASWGDKTNSMLIVPTTYKNKENKRHNDPNEDGY